MGLESEREREREIERERRRGRERREVDYQSEIIDLALPFPERVKTIMERCFANKICSN